MILHFVAVLVFKVAVPGGNCPHVLLSFIVALLPMMLESLLCKEMSLLSLFPP